MNFEQLDNGICTSIIWTKPINKADQFDQNVRFKCVIVKSCNKRLQIMGLIRSK